MTKSVKVEIFMYHSVIVDNKQPKVTFIVIRDRIGDRRNEDNRNQE